MTDNSVNARFKAFRKVADVNQSQLARSIALSPAYISDVERGLKDPSRRMIERLIEKYNVNANWLLSGVGDMFIEPTTIRRRLDTSILENENDGSRLDQLGGISIRFYPNYVSDESGSLDDASIIPIPGDMIRPYEPDQVRAVVVVSDSMVGAGLYPNDVVLFTTEYQRGSGIYVLRLPHSFSVHRLEFRLNGSVRVLSDNEAYDAEEILIGDPDTGDNPITIEGRVIGWFHRYRG